MTVDLPDYQGRVAILQVHARNKPLAPDVDITAVARLTPGFSGQYYFIVIDTGERGQMGIENDRNINHFTIPCTPQVPSCRIF